MKQYVGGGLSMALAIASLIVSGRVYATAENMSLNEVVVASVYLLTGLILAMTAIALTVLRDSAQDYEKFNEGHEDCLE
jgi:hypothetical protein